MKDRGGPSFASHAQAIEAERQRAESLAEKARKDAEREAARAKKRAAAESRKAARRDRAEARRLASAERRIQEAEAVAEKIAKKHAALGKLASQAVETSLLLQEYPDLAKPFLDEFRGMVKPDGRQPPNAANIKAAMQTVLDGIADAWDAIEEDPLLCDVDETDTEPLDQWQPTRAEVEFLKKRFFPMLFAPRPKPAEPTTTAPGSPARIEDMAARQEAGEDLYRDDDTPADGKKVQTKERANGGGMQVLGWLAGSEEPLSLRDEAAREAERIRAKLKKTGDGR